MGDIIRPKRILFKCKGNICRSPAAEIILKAYRPDWQVFSCATTPNTIGQSIHPNIIYALKGLNFHVPDLHRPVMYQDWILEYMPYFDEIHDLHLEGISDPYHTHRFRDSCMEIIDYIQTIILDEEE